jgi:hypothetical protein
VLWLLLSFPFLCTFFLSLAGRLLSKNFSLSGAAANVSVCGREREREKASEMVDEW